MALNQNERTVLEKKLLKATEEGAITLWTERMAQLAKQAGCSVERIDWAGPPDIIAARIVDYASRLINGIDRLEAQINNM